MIIPVFSTNLSLGSILTLEPSGKSTPAQPPSLFDAAKDLNLTQIWVSDNYFVSFLRLLKLCKAENLQLIYGIKFVFCADCNDKTPESRRTEAKYHIFARNGNGIKILQKLYSECATKYLFSHKEWNNSKEYKRCDFGVLKRYWNNDDLLLVSCFYDGIIYSNNLRNNNHIPDFSYISNPIFELQSNNLPFDELLREKVVNYCSANGYKTFETKSIYYRYRKEALPYQIYRAILQRTTFQKPELFSFASDSFCVESLLEKQNP